MVRPGVHRAGVHLTFTCLSLLMVGVAHAQQGGGTPASTPPATAGAPTAVQLAPGVPPPEALLMLIRNALSALNQANFTGNYTVLHGLGTPTLQTNNSPAQLGITFTALRDQHVDLSPALVLSPELTSPPSLLADGQLRLVGFFASQPLRITFAMAFRPVAGRWRIDELAVATAPAPPAAAPAPQPGTPAAGSAAPKPAVKGDPKKP
jgi:hypothetical protein